MLKAEHLGVEGHPIMGPRRVMGGSKSSVTQERMPKLRKMATDLIATPRLQADGHGRGIVVPRRRLEMGERAFPVDWAIERSTCRAKASRDDSHIFALESMRGELLGKPRRGGGVTREDQKT